MKQKIETYGEVKSGSLRIIHRKKFVGALKTWKDCRVKLTVEKAYKKRSSMQNAYYWGVIIQIWHDIILEEWQEDWSKERTHDFLKMHFLTEEKVNENTGEVLKIPLSTTEQTTTELEEYFSRCRNAAFEMFNVIIPLPNEQTELF